MKPRVFFHHHLNAFTMVEVVLAMGIISVALVAILGLFPLALGTARDSQTETRATLLAQNTLSDLAVQGGVRVYSGWNYNVLRSSQVLLTNSYNIDGQLLNSGGFFQQRITSNPIYIQASFTNWQVSIYTAWPSLARPSGSNTFCRIISRP